VSQYSPLHNFHEAAGAKLADFGGWQMPIEYPASNGGGVISEHQAVRTKVGLFDVSHLGKILVTGDGALEFLNSVLTNDLNRIKDGQAQYNLICDPLSGGVIDDLIAYRFSATKVFLIPNAANSYEVEQRLNSAKPKQITVENQHKTYSVLALQGPQSKLVLERLGISTTLEYMSFRNTNLDAFEITLCRTGYTGELGFEILTKWDDAAEVWERLHSVVKDLGGLLAGLGARDTLRTEMGYPLHGHELSLQITPVEASAGWAIAWEKEFWGKQVLTTQKNDKSHRVLQGLILTERGIPRAGMRVMNQSGEVIGEVTSGTFSPTLKTGIALALLSTKMSIETRLQIDIRGKATAAIVTRLPFVESHVR
jgi:aminomethyltransferase